MADNFYAKTKQAYPQKVTQQVRRAFLMADLPSVNLMNWQGYFRNTDPTILPPNVLTFPSINCFIPNKDKIVPRLGTTLLGQDFTANKNWPAFGHKKRFATMGGLELEVRVNQTDDANLKDVIKILYQNPVSLDMQWYQITENVNPLPAGLHRYYFDDWFDTNENTALSLNLSRLIWVNGLDKIFSWTGGVSVIGTVVANTSISTVGGVTWASLGFVDPTLDPSSSGNIIVNGVKYIVSGGWSTNTLLLSNTSGISVNDIATSEIQVNNAPIPFDVCSENKGYMYYGHWNSRRLFQSNGFNHPSEVFIVSFSGGFLNDLILPPNPVYTGTGSHVFHVAIDSISPTINDEVQIFVSPTGGTNDTSFNTSGYSGNTNINVYRAVIISDQILTPRAGTHVGVFIDAEAVVGGTTGAVGKLLQGTNDFGGGAAYVQLLTPDLPFQTGETITGQSSGATVNLFFAQYGNTFQLYKNNVAVALTPPGFSYPCFGTWDNTNAMPDGLTITWPSYTSHNVGDYIELTIQKDPGGPDTFKWWIDNNAATTGVTITGGLQTLQDGVQIQFGTDRGHTVGDQWNIQVNQAINQAWANFYFTTPVRKVGEGWIYQLPSNFWAMGTQEEQMYVNTQYGYWSYVQTTLSADLQNESVTLQPLKQASSSKVLFPYMLTHLEDYLIYVTTDKKLDMIGRQKLLQLPQTKSISQPVAQDFVEATFEDGSMEYWDQRLWITSPKESIMLCYDNQPTNKYWQPPQVISENGILSIVENTLISHSNIRDHSFNLFTGTSGDLGGTYTVRARSAYVSAGNRWGYKDTNKSFLEGYVSGDPGMIARVYSGIGGCGGIIPHPVKPITCLLPDTAPFGEGPLGSHQNGSDIFQTDSHFYEIFPKYLPQLKYRFLALEAECTTTNHSYSWLSMGINEVVSTKGNNDLINKDIISRQ